MAIVRRLRVLCLVLVTLVVACSSGAEVPTVRRLGPPGGIFEPSELIAALKGDCPSDKGGVRLDLTQGDVHLQPTFACNVVRKNPTAAQSELVNLVADRDNATRRAERIEMMQRKLGVTVDYQALVWPRQRTRRLLLHPCRRHSLQRGEIKSSTSFQSPLVWTEIEAAKVVAGDRPRNWLRSSSHPSPPPANRLSPAQCAQLRALGVSSQDAADKRSVTSSRRHCGAPGWTRRCSQAAENQGNLCVCPTDTPSALCAPSSPGSLVSALLLRSRAFSIPARVGLGLRAVSRVPRRSPRAWPIRSLGSRTVEATAAV